MKVTGIILAGGIGSRVGGDVPKQFIEINDKPIILYSVETFVQNKDIENIIIVCNKDNISTLETILKESGQLDKIFIIVPGGKTRQESSRLGIEAVNPDTDIILIHDSSRPFVTDKIIEDVICEAFNTGASGPVVPVVDTVVTLREDFFIDKIPSRKIIKKIQTPQAFQYEIIKEAHQWALIKGYQNFTDDCGIVIKKGEQVKLVPGDETNIKITSPIDMVCAEYICRGSY